MVQHRWRDFIEDYSVIPQHQLGFRPGRSCNHQLLLVTDFIRDQLAQKKSVGMLCLDLTSAFDCVQHDMLTYKMSTLGFLLYLLKVVDSFLTRRRFRVAIGNVTSTFTDMEVGVPQGSVISPTLFNVYVYDVPVPPGVI